MAPRPVIEGIVAIVRECFDDDVRGAPLIEGKPPSWGCCAVATVVLQDHLGGKIMRTVVNGASHYFLELDDGTVVDATWDQFGFVFETDGVVVERTREYALTAKPSTADRYLLLKERVDGKL